MEISCITLSGQHGTGTSSAGKLLAKKLNFRFVSAGDLFRESAKRREIDIREFTKIVEGDPFLKNRLDEKLREESRRGQVVVEGRLTGWIAKESAELRVLLTAPLEVRVERISKRDNESIEVSLGSTSTSTPATNPSTNTTTTTTTPSPFDPDVLNLVFLVMTTGSVLIILVIVVSIVRQRSRKQYQFR